MADRRGPCEHPEVIFLSEAFTRPKVMKALAKAGFTQSYTYFTWRNFKQEFREYGEELTQTPMREFMRGNFFTNTHDILRRSCRRADDQHSSFESVLAATMSSVYGIYSGFELCENTPVPGKEEYLNSEKYEYKVWDWDRRGNIIRLYGPAQCHPRDHPACRNTIICDSSRLPTNRSSPTTRRLRTIGHRAGCRESRSLPRPRHEAHAAARTPWHGPHCSDPCPGTFQQSNLHVDWPRTGPPPRSGRKPGGHLHPVCLGTS